MAARQTTAEAGASGLARRLGVVGAEVKELGRELVADAPMAAAQAVRNGPPLFPAPAAM